MTIPIATMYDTIGSSSNNIPNTADYVAGYVTGIGSVPWTAAEWDRFPNSRRIRIAQGAGVPVGPSQYDVIDVETGAVTPSQAAQMIKARVDAGIVWTTVYGTDSTLNEVTGLVQALGSHYWIGHVEYWLADWSLSETQAITKIGTQIHGATCIAVQWASPTSNPHTTLPNSSITLQQSNVDLSVVNAQWVPFSNVPLSPPQYPSNQQGVVVSYTTRLSRDVQSVDGGKTWR